MNKAQAQRQRERRRLKEAGWICLRYYGTSGPYAWKLPGKTKWLTREEALEALAPTVREGETP